MKLLKYTADSTVLAALMVRREKITALAPKYDYDMPLIPVWPQMIADAVEKLDRVAAMYAATGNYAFVAASLTTSPRCPIDYSAVASARNREVKAIRAARKDAREQNGYSAASMLHRRISSRSAGEILARQQKIEYAMLLNAHRSPGHSMTDNLRRSNHPTCTRLATAV